MLTLEDQLDRDERLRAEALGLAIQFAGAQGPVVPGKGDTIASIAGSLHELAAEFVKYIEDGLPVVEEEEDEEERE